MTWDGKAGSGKATFDDLYDLPDPRGLFGALETLEYAIPDHAHEVFRALLRARATSAAEQLTVLDLCSSYGVNAALLRTDLGLVDLFRRYHDAAVVAAATDELMTLDRAFFADHQRPDAPRVLGLDTAGRAIAYGRSVGLLHDGWAENLETDEPSESLVRGLTDVDLVTATGGVGYITERTFDRLMVSGPTGRRPWVAAFVLRMFPYDGIAQTLGRHGLVTEQLHGVTFAQRRFASSREQDAAVAEVRRRGLDTRGLEEDGWYHTDLFVSRPVQDIRDRPLRDLLAQHIA